MKKKTDTPVSVYTITTPVLWCSDLTQVLEIMELCKIPRSLTYNKLGSLQGWNLHWMKANKIVQMVLSSKESKLPAKLWDYTVEDTMKCISAQQESAKVSIIREIYKKTQDVDERKSLCALLKEVPTKDPWLHRVFRKYYRRGHSNKNNQIVYQKQGYSCKRLSRNSYQLEIQGLQNGKRISLRIKSRLKPAGQLRILLSSENKLIISFQKTRSIPLTHMNITESLGLDKGYTEAFYASNGNVIGEKLGSILTKKTNRINSINKNRNRLLQHSKKTNNKNILKNNLGSKKKNRKLQQEKDVIQNLVMRDLRCLITKPTHIVCEDLTSKFSGSHYKFLNRKLNQWVKGKLQNFIEKVTKETGSILTIVNSAYTSQEDYPTGTLLGLQNDNFLL